MSSMYVRICLASWFGGDIASVHECIITVNYNLFCYVLWVLTFVCVCVWGGVGGGIKVCD